MIVVLDIETVQAPREEWARLVGLDSASDAAEWNDLGADLFSRADADDRRRREDEAYERSAFDGTFSKIVCIGVIMFKSLV